MEPHRASPLLRSFTQLGRRTAGFLPKDPQLCPHHPNPNRAQGPCLSRPPTLPVRSQTYTQSNCFTSIAAPRNSARMELHYQATTVNLFLRHSLAGVASRCKESHLSSANRGVGTGSSLQCASCTAFAASALASRRPT